MIYIDNAATRLGNYGSFNANSSYATAEKINLQKARLSIANVINCNEDEIYFTSGGCESNSWALQRISKSVIKNHIITTKIEHSSTMNCCKWLESNGYEVTYLDVDEHGYIDLHQLEKSIRGNTFLISVMHVNNEIGTIQNIRRIGEIAHAYGIYFHTDAVQSMGKIDIDVKRDNIDLLSASGHKFGTNNGVGFLYCSKNVKLEPLIFGGSQEQGIRGGTTNYQSIIRMADALVSAHSNNYIKEYVKELVVYLKDNIKQLNNDLIMNTPEDCDSGIVSVSFKHIDAESLMVFLSDFKVYVSAGSACNVEEKEVSHVLKAIKVPEDYIKGTIRFSVSEFNTKQQIDTAILLVDNYLRYALEREENEKD